MFQMVFRRGDAAALRGPVGAATNGMAQYSRASSRLNRWPADTVSVIAGYLTPCAASGERLQPPHLLPHRLESNVSNPMSRGCTQPTVQLHLVSRAPTLAILTCQPLRRNLFNSYAVVHNGLP